jgi:hydroxyacylglutathione hydrolase
MRFRIRPFVAPGFAENAYIAWRDDSRSAVCVDPGSAAQQMLEFLRDEQLSLAAILLTHAHLDHIEGVAAVVRETGAPIHMHPDDDLLYRHVGEQARQFGVRVESPPPVDHALAHGQRLEIGEVAYEVRHAPGHSPGHVILYVPDAACAFVGDVVFQGSIGRTDLPGGDYGRLIQSIREQVLTLPDATQLYCGHGPSTTVGHERGTNPFLIPHYGGGLA